MSSEAPTGQSVPAIETSAFDELADLFLGDDPVPVREASPESGVTVSTLIVGHLPVIAAPWVAQHARDMAKSVQAPVAVLSRSGDRTTLDLYNAPQLKEQQTIEGAIRQAVNAGCLRWLIRADAVTELDLMDHDRVDSMTLLTGADDAAVVGAYRAIKGLVSESSELDEHAVKINLAVMGSPAPKARGAAEKIRKAVQSFLETGLASVTLSEKVSVGGSSVRIFDESSETSLNELISMIPREAGRPGPRPEGSMDFSDVNQSGNLRLAGEPGFESDEDPSRSQSMPGTASVTSRHAPSAVVRELKSEAESRETGDATGSSSRVGPMDTASCAHAPLLGLLSVEARCPYADDVEIATDHEGRMHLIGTTIGQDISRSLESLQIAEAWAAAHAPLLMAATGGKIKANPPLGSHQHLIVEHAASARRLLDGELSVYVLAKGTHETLCVPLN